MRLHRGKNRDLGITLRGPWRLEMPISADILFIDGAYEPDGFESLNFGSMDVMETGIVPKLETLNRIFNIPNRENRATGLATVIKITFHTESKLTRELFGDILEFYGYNQPKYVIVTDYGTYERLPDIGKPGNDIQTTEGIIETWELYPGTTMFYMPLRGNFSDKEIDIWHKVFSQIL